MHNAITLREGELIAQRFLVESLAGLGGMGAVYRTLDLQTRQRAALKVITHQRGSSAERFTREALVLAKLTHPSIVRYIAHGTTSSNALFLAMEWLEGEDLSARLGGDGLDVRQSFALLARMCDGLAAAHRQGVVHRDVKPSNIFLPDGEATRAKLLDFGVARQEALTRPLTHAGAVVGTVGYMAPEQAMGAFDVDARADVFALGCVLFELLTGRAAFAAQHDVAVLAKVLREEPPLVSDLRPELGTRFDNLLRRMLAKDREVRPRGMEELRRALDSVRLSAFEAPVQPKPVRRARMVESEQRIVSVILGRSPQAAQATLGAEDAAREAESFAQLVELFQAEATPLQGSGMVLVLGGGGGSNASDQAVQAARCALRLRHLRPTLTLSVATGAVETTSHFPVGAAIDRAAAQLEGLLDAPPGVAVDQLTAGLIGTLFELEHAHGLLLLVGERDDAEAPRLLMGKPTPCVGRDKELALLDATLSECLEDDIARVVLITAAPGVGKSRLGHEFLERVRGRGVARVLVARADPLSAGSSYGLMRRLIRSAMGLRAGDPAALQQARVRAHLEALVQGDARPQLEEFLCELLDVPLTRGGSALLRGARADPEVMREQNRRALAAWFDAESARRPLVLLLEDLHWGDLPSVTYLGELLHRFEGRPILLLALARPEVRSTFPALWSGLSVHELQLNSLTRRAAERLVNATLSARASPEVATRIVELAEGNAFYLEELIRRAAEGGIDFPETVVAMAQSRLNALTPAARRALRAASVFGETSWADAVQTLLGEESDAQSLLDELVREEVLLYRAQGRFVEEREYIFRHAFLRDAAYGMLGALDLSRAHRAAGDWLSAHGEKDARVLADHFERGGSPQRAIPWLVRAALTAVEAGDFASSLALAQRGLALGATGHERGALLLVNANATAWGARPDLSQLPEALDLLPHASSPWWWAVSVLIFGSSSNGNMQAAASYMKLAASTPPGPELTGFYGQALQTLASSSVLLGQTELGWALVQRFDHVQPDDPRCDPLFLAWRDLARSHVALYTPVAGRWQLERAIAWAREAADAMAVAGSRSGEAVALFILGKAWLFVGAYPEAEAALRRGVQRATQAGNDVSRQYSKLVLSRLALHRGSVDLALEELASEQPSDCNVARGFECVRAEARYLAGDPEQALHAALACADDSSAPSRRMAWATVARSYLALRRDDDALRAVAQAFGMGDTSPDLEFEIDLRNTRVRALLRLGQREAARAELGFSLALLRDVVSPIEAAALRRTFREGIATHRELGLLAREHLDEPALHQGSP